MLTTEAHAKRNTDSHRTLGGPSLPGPSPEDDTESPHGVLESTTNLSRDAEFMECEKLIRQGTFEMRLKYYEDVVHSLLREWMELGSAPPFRPPASQLTPGAWQLMSPATQPAPDYSGKDDDKGSVKTSGGESEQSTALYSANRSAEVDLVGRALDVWVLRESLPSGCGRQFLHCKAKHPTP
jgi:hypothetical protein